jgi:hypothetical protein
MRDDYTEWERFSHPDPDEEDPPTREQVLQMKELIIRLFEWFVLVTTAQHTVSFCLGKRFSHPDPDEEDPPTLDEIQSLREFAERYGTSDTIPADNAARKLMSV